PFLGISLRSTTKSPMRSIQPSPLRCAGVSIEPPVGNRKLALTHPSTAAPSFSALTRNHFLLADSSSFSTTLFADNSVLIASLVLGPFLTFRPSTVTRN